MPSTKKMHASKVSAEELQLRIEKLEAENSKLKSEILLSAQTQDKRPYKFLRNSGTIFFITLSIVSFMLFNVSSWVKNTILDTDTFVATTQPLISQPEVQQALQRDITNALFEKVNVEQELQNALPENIAFLSGPLAGQIESFTSNKVGEVLASPQLYSIWGKTLESVHSKVIEYIQNDSADGVISVNDLYTAVSNRIAEDGKLGFLTNKQLPPKLGTITVKEITWLPEVRQYVDALTVTPLIFLGISIASFLLAVALAFRRKTVALTGVILLAVMMLSTYVALLVGGGQVANLAQQQNQSFVQAVYSTITAPLENRTLGYASLFSAIALVGILTAKIDWLVRLRTNIDKRLVQWANVVLPKMDAPSWLVSFSSHIGVICWTVFLLLFIVIGVRIPPEYTEIKNAVFWATIAVSIAYLVHVVSRALRHTK